MVTVSPITARERREIQKANESGRTPVVFVHGLWLHASSWGPWRDYFEREGYATLAPGYPGDPESVAASRERPEAFAGTGIAEVTAHYASIIRRLNDPPLIIGHSVGGLITQQLLAQGLGAGGVAIDSVPFRGVLPMPRSTLKALFPILKNPANRTRAVSLTREQFRYAFGNALPDDVADALHDAFAIPAPARPLFQVATANLDPQTEARVDTMHERGAPLLLVSGDEDHTIPFAITKASYEKQRRADAVTELETFAGRGHSLTIDPGWPELAEHAKAFFERNTLAAPAGAGHVKTTVRHG